jgi:Tc5 transposase DNA-binding domain/Fission yeast centromere protein N-terminal domain
MKSVLLLISKLKMPPKTVPKSDRKRHKITDLQRAALQQRYATQKEAGAAVDHKSLARWFQNTYQFPIDLSMVSRYLGPRYKHLDAGVSRLDASKSRISKWSLLEEALFAWQQRAQNAHLVISGDILKEKAAQFWPILYPGIEPPKFSTGWLDGFKARYSIKSRKKHGEDADVDEEGSTEAIHNIRIQTALYNLCNLYNIDEAGLY